MIQDLIDQAPPGSTVTVPSGLYSIDPINAPVKLKSGITLDLTNVVLQSIKTDIRSVYGVVQIIGVNNVTIINGAILGDRLLRPNDPTLGGIGHGIMVGLGATNVILRNLKIHDCFGDGLLIWGAKTVEVDHTTCDGNRRQGITVTDSSTVYIHDGQSSNNGQGADPGDGIDLENDLETETIDTVEVERMTFFGNKGSDIGVGSPGQYANIQLRPTNSFTGVTQPIWVAGNAGNLGTPWWALALNRVYSWSPSYRYWGYPKAWYK